MKFNCFFLICFFSTFAYFSQELIQDKNASTISFKIKNFGLLVDGNFNDFKFSSNFHSENIKESFINAEIDVASIFTDFKSRDEHLLKSDFFDVEKYPKIIFKSSEITKNTRSNYILKGTLTIKGIPKKVAVPLEIKQVKKRFVFLANFSLKRTDFNIGGNSFVLSKNVNITMKYVATRN